MHWRVRVLVTVAILLFGPSARASGLDDVPAGLDMHGEDRWTESLQDGDVDSFEGPGRRFLSLQFHYRATPRTSTSGSSIQMRGFGAGIVVGFPFDVFGQTRASMPIARESPFPRRAIVPLLVTEAWRCAGLYGVESAEQVAKRARIAGWLPEMRLRAMRVVDRTAQTDATTFPGDARSRDTLGTDLWLEGRLTWRLDRLSYADDEPQLLRLRAERADAKAKLARSTVETYFRWEKALREWRRSNIDSEASTEAELRTAEARATLDALTGGYFSRQIPIETTGEGSSAP